MFEPVVTSRTGTPPRLGKTSYGADGIAEHNTWESTVYSCVVLNVFSRKAVGWAVDRRPEIRLVNLALVTGYSSRQSAVGGLIHTDHGAQFTLWAFTCHVNKYVPGLSPEPIGDCCGTTLTESF